MRHNQFDSFARAFALRSRSRRTVLGALSGGVALAVAFPTSEQQVAAKANEKAGKAKDACRGEGHPCEGNQVCCDGLVCGAGGPGAANRCSVPSDCPSCGGQDAVAPAPVAAVAAYSVSVACAYDAKADLTTCTCSSVAPVGAAAVRSVAVSSSAVCADVVGGDASLGSPGPAVSGAGYTSSDGQAVLTLILSGEVTVSGAATYWCMTDAGTVPAPGPGLLRVQNDLSESFGAIEVRTSECDVAMPVSNGFDWHGVCAHPAPGAAFILNLLGDDAGATANATSAIDGRAIFGKLAPGAYQLKQSNAAWCHAESDSVDAKGNVIVSAGKRSTVWVFDCVRGSGG